MSKNGDLLTKPKFQVSAVSKKPELLTEPVFQRPSVSKKPELLTARCSAVLFGTHATLGNVREGTACGGVERSETVPERSCRHR